MQANGRDKHVGYFNNEEAAAWAYDRAVITHNPGWTTESAVMLKLNFPDAVPKNGTYNDVEDEDQEVRDSVGAINMILAASQTPAMPQIVHGVEPETPPPHVNTDAAACVFPGETGQRSADGSWGQGTASFHDFALSCAYCVLLFVRVVSCACSAMFLLAFCRGQLSECSVK